MTLARPPGPAPVTKAPWSLLRYMQRMQAGGAALVGQRFERYGDLYYAPFLGRDVYVVRHPDHVQDVLVRDAAKYAKPESGLTARQLSRLLGDGLLNANGDAWRHRRRLLQPAFRPARLRGYADAITALTEKRLARWGDDETRDVSREMMELTLAIVSKTLFDHDVDDETDDVAEAMRAFRDLFASPAAVLPDWVPSPGRAKFRAALGAIDAVVHAMVDRRRRAGEGGDDLLSELLYPVDLDAARLDDRALRDELLTLFIAGHETTSHALSWSMHLLSEAPEVAAGVREELDQVLGARAPGYDDLAALPRVLQVLEEAMRLFPPAYVVPRVCIEEAQLGAYTIPRGADIVVWIHHVHRDARWFPEPLRFDPTRFAPEAKRAIPKGAYLPFGAGTRTCIGKQFALIEAQLILARVLQRFELAPAPGVSVEASMAVTTAPKGGLPLVLRQRGAT